MRCNFARPQHTQHTGKTKNNKIFLFVVVDAVCFMFIFFSMEENSLLVRNGTICSLFNSQFTIYNFRNELLGPPFVDAEIVDEWVNNTRMLSRPFVVCSKVQTKMSIEIGNNVFSFVNLCIAGTPHRMQNNKIENRFVATSNELQHKSMCTTAHTNSNTSLEFAIIIINEILITILWVFDVCIRMTHRKRMKQI